MKTARAFGVGLGSIFDNRFSYVSLEVMRSVNGRLEVVGGLDPFAQFDPEALTSEVETRNTSLLFILSLSNKVRVLSNFAREL